MRTVTIPPSAGDRVAALRIQALHRTNRIVAALGTPLVLWAAWSWRQDRAFVVTAIILASLLAFPATLPARARTLRRFSPVAGLLCAATVSWLWDGAFATTGLLLWSSAILAALAIGRGPAVVLGLGAVFMLLSAPIAASRWVLPTTVRAVDADILTRFVFIFGVLSATILIVTWTVITPLERSLTAATRLVQDLRREQRARAVLDVRRVEHDEDTRIGLARRLRRLLHGRLTSLERSLASAGRGDEVERAAVDRAVTTVAELIEQIRAAARQLRPVLLDEAGLAPALAALAQSQLGRTAIAYDTDFQIPRRLSPAIEVACYRIVQEAIDNVVHHARATSVRLAATAHAHDLEVVVDDNGIGFDPQHATRDDPGDPSRGGLFAMRQRSEALGGTVRIESGPGRGTRVRVTLPLRGSM
jgi:signal transduction histidine kinase